MRAFWHELWGSGRGPVSRLAPQSRIAGGAIFFAACLAAPAGRGEGIALIAAIAAGWAAGCGMPRKALRSFALLGLAAFLPYFLLAPFLLPPHTAAAGPERLAAGLAAPWDAFLHGLAGLFVAAATMTALSISDLRRGLLALPLPRVISAVLIQIVQQTGTLLAETGRIASAVALRGGSGRASAGWRVAASLPRVWMPRIIGRAERVAAAMELRGYAEADLRVLGRGKLRPVDAAAPAAAIVTLVLAAGLRWGWIG